MTARDPMTVGQLRAALEDVPDDLLVATTQHDSFPWTRDVVGAKASVTLPPHNGRFVLFGGPPKAIIETTRG